MLEDLSGVPTRAQRRVNVDPVRPNGEQRQNLAGHRGPVNDADFGFPISDFGSFIANCFSPPG
jgi:hypothetical protein